MFGTPGSVRCYLVRLRRRVLAALSYMIMMLGACSVRRRDGAASSRLLGDTGTHPLELSSRIPARWCWAPRRRSPTNRTASAWTTVLGERVNSLSAPWMLDLDVRVEVCGIRTDERRNNVLKCQRTAGPWTASSSYVGTGQPRWRRLLLKGATIETKNSDYSGLLTANSRADRGRGRDVVNLLRLLLGVHYESGYRSDGRAAPHCTISTSGLSGSNWDRSRSTA